MWHFQSHSKIGMKYILNTVLLQKTKFRPHLGERKNHLWCKIVMDSQNKRILSWADHGCRKWCFKVRGSWSHHLLELKDIFQHVKSVFLESRSQRDRSLKMYQEHCMHERKKKDKDAMEKKLKKKQTERIWKRLQQCRNIFKLLLSEKDLLKKNKESKHWGKKKSGGGGRESNTDGCTKDKNKGRC